MPPTWKSRLTLLPTTPVEPGAMPAVAVLKPALRTDREETEQNVRRACHATVVAAARPQPARAIARHIGDTGAVERCRTGRVGNQSYEQAQNSI